MRAGCAVAHNARMFSRAALGCSLRPRLVLVPSLTIHIGERVANSVSPTNQHGWTALHHAANWGYVDCVKKLLDLGADPYSQVRSGAVLEAAHDASSWNTSDMHSATLLSQSEGGHTPMEAAAFKGWDAVVSVFKERADVEFEDFFAGSFPPFSSVAACKRPLAASHVLCLVCV
jgi:hypothetical protein